MFRGRFNTKMSNFSVDDILFINHQNSVNSQSRVPKSLGEFRTNNIVAIVSGLNFGYPDESGNLLHSRNNLIRFINGQLSVNPELRRVVRNINKLVICGNMSYCSDLFQAERNSYLKEEITKRIYEDTYANYTKANDYIKILSGFVQLDIMPGEDDLSNSFFPQLPLDRVLFESLDEKNPKLVGNPYKLTYDNVDIVGTSGQNIKGVKKFSSIGNTLDVMERNLLWGHYAPSCPDNIWSIPISNEDPLVISPKDLPDIYFTGGQKHFESRLVEYDNKVICLASIPDFNEQQEVVLVDIQTKDIMVYKIDHQIVSNYS